MKILSLLCTITLLINSVIYLKRFAVNSKPFKVFVLYLVYISIFQTSSAVLNRMHIHNLFLSHFYFIGQFILLSFFYSKVLDSTVFKRIVGVLSSGVIITIGVNFYLSPDIFFKFSLLEIVLTMSSLVLYSLFYFYESFGEENKKFLILNSGIFFYLLSSILIFSAGNFIIESNLHLKNIIWRINYFLYLFYQMVVFIEWYKNYRKV